MNIIQIEKNLGAKVFGGNVADVSFSARALRYFNIFR